MTPYGEMDPTEKPFWTWVAKVESTIRLRTHRPEFDIHKCDLQLIEQMYYDELDPSTAARAVISEVNWA